MFNSGEESAAMFEWLKKYTTKECRYTSFVKLVHQAKGKRTFGNSLGVRLEVPWSVSLIHPRRLSFITFPVRKSEISIDLIMLLDWLLIKVLTVPTLPGIP
jgi:hypothetical protein